MAPGTGRLISSPDFPKDTGRDFPAVTNEGRPKRGPGPADLAGTARGAGWAASIKKAIWKAIERAGRSGIRPGVRPAHAGTVLGARNSPDPVLPGRNTSILGRQKERIFLDSVRFSLHSRINGIFNFDNIVKSKI